LCLDDDNVLQLLSCGADKVVMFHTAHVQTVSVRLMISKVIIP